MRTRTSRMAVAAVLLAASAIVLGACRSEEQGRVTVYKKGQYLGQKDDTLSDKTLVEIRERTAAQAGGSLGVAATVPSRGSDVRLDPPKQ